MNNIIDLTITIMSKKKIFPPSARKRRRAATDIQAAWRGVSLRASTGRWHCNKSGCNGGQAFQGETDGLLYCSPACAGWSDEDDEPEPDICCDLCDYTISQSDLDHGRGRVMKRVGDQLRVCDCCESDSDDEHDCEEDCEDCDDGLERMFCGATRQWLTREEWECECDSEDEDQIDCFHCRIGPHVVNGWN